MFMIIGLLAVIIYIEKDRKDTNAKLKYLGDQIDKKLK